FASEKLPVKAFRALREKGAAFDAATWKEMAELGFAGVIVPETHGGSGFGYVGFGQVLEAQGRTLASTPLLSTALVGASAFLIGGSELQKQAFLPKIASGEYRIALAVDEGAHHDPEHILVSADPVDGGYELVGEKRYVVDGAEADLIILAARV